MVGHPIEGRPRTKQYRIVRQIARGGMGEVYLATMLGPAGFSKEVVLKRITSRHAGDALHLAMFLQEARVAALLDHPNVVQVFGLERSGNQYFIVMEHVAGVSLAALLREIPQRLTVAAALQVAADVAKGLTFIHEKRDARGQPLRLVHRDLSPSNILVSSSGAIKIADFGIAKALAQGPQSQAGVIKGKCAYLAPEQARGVPADQQSDLYTLGLVIYEMTTGQRAYPGSAMTALARVSRGAFVPPEVVVPGYPGDLRAVVMRALAFDPADRYPSARALLDDLELLRAQRRARPRLGPFVQTLLDRERAARGAADSPDSDALLPTVPVVTPVEVETGALAAVREPTAETIRQVRPMAPGPGQTPYDRGLLALALARDEMTLTALTGLTPIRGRRLALRHVLALVACFALAGATPWHRPGDNRPASSPGTRSAPHPRAAAPSMLPVAPRGSATEARAADGSRPRRRRADVPPRRPRRARCLLALSSRPPLEVFLAGRHLGRTPLRARVPRRRLRLTLRNRALGIEVRRAVDARRPRLRLAIRLREGRIAFDLPPGVHVMLDGRALGRPPLPPVTAYEGRHLAVITSAFRYNSRRIPVRVWPGRTTRVTQATPIIED